MRAPSLEEIYKFEHYIEGAFQSVLQGDGIAAHRQRGGSVLQTPYVALQLSMGAARGQKAIDNHGIIRDAHFDAELSAQVTTTRTGDARIDSHLDYVARIRMHLSDAPSRFTREMLPYHAIALYTSGASAYSIDPDDNLDITELRYQLVIVIRENAWPIAD